jgi:hypothetical protein
VDTAPEPPAAKRAPEPSKWNLLAWIWWRLGEPTPGEFQPFEPTSDGIELLADLARAGSDDWRSGPTPPG